MSARTRGFTLVTYAAALDVSRHTVEFLARLLGAHRRGIGMPKGSRALGPFRQVALVLRWFRERGCVHCLARDAEIAQATGYRYLHEGIDVLAAQAPDLHEVLDLCHAEGMTHLVLDGTLIACDRLAGVRENGNDLWFSRKHKGFGGNIQFLAAPDGIPLWGSDVEPGSPGHHRGPYPRAARTVQSRRRRATHARRQGLHRRRYRYSCAVRRPKGRSETDLDRGIRARNALIRHVRARGERTAAELKERWRTLKHVTLSPSRIGDITRAALVLNGQWK